MKITVLLNQPHFRPWKQQQLGVAQLHTLLTPFFSDVFKSELNWKVSPQSSYTTHICQRQQLNEESDLNILTQKKIFTEKKSQLVPFIFRFLNQ